MNAYQLKHISYSDMKENHRLGYISDHDWRLYRFFWIWSYPRFGGEAGLKHDRVFARIGVDRYYRRINRVRRWIGFGEFNIPEIHK